MWFIFIGGNMKGYIFDMDGTLLDSLQAWHNIGNHYLESLGLKGADDLDEKLAHMALDDGAVYINERFHLNKTTNEIIEGVKQIISHQYEEIIPLKPGVQDFLEKCHQKGYLMCVLTASDSLLAKKAFQRLGILDYFIDVYACHEIGLNKTDPESYLRVAQKMQLNKEDVIIVEDALHAIKTAKKAGFHVIAVYDQENQNDWQEIKSIADESYETLKRASV